MGHARRWPSRNAGPLKSACYLRLGLRLIDRYLCRAVIPPFLIALGTFTFLMAINPMLEYAQRLIAKGVELPTVGILLLTLLPSSLSLTIPISFLTGLLIGLGRLSGDRESVALQACGVGPLRILRPVLILAVAVAAFDMYVLMRLKPDANQLFRDITFQLLSEKSASEIKPRVFYEGFPQKVIYVQNSTAAGAWTGVMVADTTDTLRPALVLAESGQLVIDKPRRLVALVLTNATRYAPGKPGTTVYTVSQEATSSVAVTAEAVFGSGGSQLRGFPEMDYAALQRSAAEAVQRGDSPHNQILHTQQMFSFPVACLVFAIIGLGLGLHTRKEGRLAGFAVAIAVVLAYYALMALSESWVKSLSESLKGSDWQRWPAYLGRWVPNLVLGIAGIILLWRRSRSVEGRVRIPLPRFFKPPKPAGGDTSPASAAGPSGDRASHPSEPDSGPQDPRHVRHDLLPAHRGARAYRAHLVVLHRHVRGLVRQGLQGTSRTLDARGAPLVSDAAVPHLHPAGRGPDWRARHHWRADAIQRAHGDAGVRDQSVSRGHADDHPGARRKRGPVCSR